MRLITPRQSSEADRLSITELGYDINELIDSAAGKLFDRLCVFQYVTIIVGPGNNGGDGIRLAQMLVQNGIRVSLCIFFITGEDKYSKNNLRLLENRLLKDADVFYIKGNANGISREEQRHLQSVCAAADCVVDAVLGTGYSPEKKRASDNLLADVLTIINDKSKYIIACDIASGVDGATGATADYAIKADETITFSYAKPGHFINPGKELTGKLEIADILVPQEAYDKASETVLVDISVNTAINSKEIKAMAVKLPERKSNSHKGSFGKLMVIGGSEGMTGAAYLASKSALLSGIGLCYIVSPRHLLRTYETLIPEAVKLPVGTKDDAIIKPEHIDSISPMIRSMDVIVCGPGIARNEITANALQKMIDIVHDERTKGHNLKLVLDADALWFLGRGMICIPHGFGGYVVTPHEAEMGRLLNIDATSVSKNRLNFATEYAKQNDCTVVLKGNDTMIASNTGKCSINDTGNSGMATGGSGDVLSGIIGAFLCSMDDFDAAELGVYIHGLAGDIAKDENTEYSVLSSTIMNSLPAAFKKMLISATK